MSEEFAGAGDAPPSKGGAGGASWKSNFPEFGFEEAITYKGKDESGAMVSKKGERRIFTWNCPAGTNNKPVLILDPLHSAAAPRRAVNIHKFKGRDGKFGSMLVSIYKDDKRGDPMNDALGEIGKDGKFHTKEPTWFWALTGIDLSVTEKTNKKGELKTYTNNRVLVLVTSQQKEQFLTMEKMGGGLRGHLFHVSRPAENPIKTFAIGTKWDPQGKITEEDMVNRFEAAAAQYGLPVEQFIRPFDYATIFKPKSYEELSKIAAEFKGFVRASSGVKVAGADASKAETSIDF